MPDIVADAQARSAEIIAEAELAIECLSGYGRPRKNALGVLNDPATYLIGLNLAREAINRALLIHADTAWPSDRDYDNS